jgi:hypothetical protein
MAGSAEGRLSGLAKVLPDRHFGPYLLKNPDRRRFPGTGFVS